MGKIPHYSINNAEPKRPRCYRAKYPYNPQKSDELQMSVGDRITDIEDAGNGWVVAHNKTTGLTGLCPKDYLQERFSVKKRMSRMKNRMSTIYLNMSQHAPGNTNSIFTISKDDKCSHESDIDLVNVKIDDVSEPRSSPWKRTFIGFLGGLFLGCLLFVVLHQLYQFTVIEAGVIAGVITLLTSIGLFISPHVRCVVALMSVTVFTGQGRVAILSLVPALLIAGPIMNMQRNINEGANSVGCVADVVYNQTLSLHHQLMASVKRQQENLENSAEQLREDISNLTTSLDQENNVTACLQRLQEVQDECEANVDKAKKACVAAGRNPIKDHRVSLNIKDKADFPSLGNKCSTVLCRMFDPGVICAHLRNTKICTTPRRSTRSISPGFKSFRQRLDELLGFHVNTSRVFDVSANNSFNPVQAIQQVKTEVQKHLDQVVRVIHILNRILIIFIILAFISAGWYLRSYHKNIKYDNIYLTSEFKRLNTRLRMSDVQKTVLPLQKKEKKKYIDSTSFKLCRAEAFAWKVGMSQVLFHIVIAVMIILLDYALYYFLLLVNRNGGTDIVISGGAFLEIDIDGIGPVADFVRNLFKGMGGSNRFQNVLNFEPCLPRASEPSQRNMILILSLYVTTLMFVLLQAYGLRLRHKLMAFFFPGRETERIHYLYRHILLKRKVRVEEEKKVNVMTDKL